MTDWNNNKYKRLISIMYLVSIIFIVVGAIFSASHGRYHKFGLFMPIGFFLGFIPYIIDNIRSRKYLNFLEQENKRLKKELEGNSKF